MAKRTQAFFWPYVHVWGKNESGKKPTEAKRENEVHFNFKDKRQQTNDGEKKEVVNGFVYFTYGHKTALDKAVVFKHLFQERDVIEVVVSKLINTNCFNGQYFTGDLL